MLTDSEKHGAVGMETFWNWEGPEAFMCYQGHPDVHPQERQTRCFGEDTEEPAVTQ